MQPEIKAIASIERNQVNCKPSFKLTTRIYSFTLFFCSLDFKSKKEKEKEKRRVWGKEVTTNVVRRVKYYNAREKKDARL